MAPRSRSPAASLVRRAGALLRRGRRLIDATGRRFYRDHCLLHASALAYTSLLSLIPVLALMFAVLKGLKVQRRLEPLLLSRLALDPGVTERMIEYIDRTNVGTLGALGAVALVLTVVSVLGTIETSFNHIWRVHAGRTWWRRVTDYLSAVLLAPLLLLAAVAITSSVQERRLLEIVLRTEYLGGPLEHLLRLAPVLMNAAALAILYAILPNRRPYVPGVALGAVVAGCTWQLVQWGYVTWQIGLAHYNAIYGALAQLPVMLVWIYLSWVVVLAGAELAAVCEFGPRESERPFARWGIAMQLLLRAAERFERHGGGVEARAIGRELGVGADAVEAVADLLRERDLLVALAGRPSAYVLACDPRVVDLATLDGLLGADALPPGCDPRIETLAAQIATRRWSGECRRLSDVLGAGGATGDRSGTPEAGTPHRRRSS